MTSSTCVLSIIYGGKGYPFLAEPVFEYLATGKYSITIPEVDIPDALLKLVVTKVATIKCYVYVIIMSAWQLYVL